MTDQSELTKLREQCDELSREVEFQKSCNSQAYHGWENTLQGLEAIAKRNAELKAENAKLREQVAHQTACISAQSATCAKYAKQLDEAVGLLRNWASKSVAGESTGVKEFLAARDAEAKQGDGG